MDLKYCSAFLQQLFLIDNACVLVTCRYFITVADMSFKTSFIASVLFVTYVSGHCDRLWTKHYIMNWAFRQGHLLKLLINLLKYLNLPTVVNSSEVLVLQIMSTVAL